MYKKVKALLSAVVAAVMLIGCGNTNTDSKVNNDMHDENKGFVHVENGKVVDASGNDILLKGIALGNDVWVMPTEPVLTSHDESSYKDIADMGFNCVRFYMNYQIFEDDSAPYTYKESGFDWIDQNIEWAKKYNVGIILNMHVPQGGYQSQGNGMGVWTDEENQKRLTALWQEFAKRYADEEIILGYGIINEPIVPKLDTIEASVDQCRDLMQKLTDAIREYDTNHMIFAERVVAVKDMSTGVSDWSISIPDTQFLLNDSNVVYEFHNYDPYSFTHQNMSWANTLGATKDYPSDEVIASNMIKAWAGCNSSSPVEELEDGWVLYQSEPAKLTNEYNVGSITLRAASTGEDGAVLFDDVVLEEYKDGTLMNTIQCLDFNDKSGTFNFWASNNVGSSSYKSNEGYTGGCMQISGTTADANISGYQFELKEGCEYIVKAKMKKINTESDAMPRIDFSLAENIMTLNSEYLESNFIPVIEFGKANNVPLYLGEFGAAITACNDDHGGEQWVSDILDICFKYGIHFTYHSYHENTFGLYQNAATSLPSQRNDKLAEVFISKLSEKSE